MSNNNLYDILNNFNKVAVTENKKPAATTEAKPKTKLEESIQQVISEKYMGFKAVEKAAKAGGAENPAAVAASIGRKKYGKKKFQAAAAKGKKLGEGWDPSQEVKQSAIQYMKSTGIRNINDLDAEAIQYIGDENQINYAEVCKILGCDLPKELGPVKSYDRHGDMEEDYASMGIGMAEENDEYDDSDMVKNELHTIIRAAEELEQHITDGKEIPAWVQSKIAQAKGMVDSASEYMISDQERNHEEESGEENFHPEIAEGCHACEMGECETHGVMSAVNEKAVSKAQQKFMGMVHAAQKGEKAASPEVAKVAKGMTKKAATDYASTKHKGLPAHVGENAFDYKNTPRQTSDDDTKTHHTKKHISTGTVYTKKFDSHGHSMGTADTVDTVKKGRGRPKKSQFENTSHKTINKMVNGIFESIDSSMYVETAPDQLSYEQSHLKDHLGSHLYKKLNSAMKTGDGFPDDLYDNLFTYFQDEMPYGIAKARTGDPYEWIENKLTEIFPELQENLLQGIGNKLATGAKAVAGGINKVIGHPDDQAMLKDLEKKTHPQTPAPAQKDSQDIEEMIRLAGLSESKKVKEADMEEGNAFGKAEQDAVKAGKDEFEVGGKTYKVKEDKTSKPDFLDIDKDGDKEESFKKAVKDKEKVKEEFAAECGEMSPMSGQSEQQGKMNISTNMSTDGNKSITITADGDTAVELMQMLKLAGVGGGQQPTAEVKPIEVVVGSTNGAEVAAEEEMAEAKDGRYEANTTPDVHVMDVQTLTKGGNGEIAGKEKQMTKHGYKFGDNPMAMKDIEEGIDKLDTMGLRLMKEYESIKIKK